MRNIYDIDSDNEDDDEEFELKSNETLTKNAKKGSSSSDLFVEVEIDLNLSAYANVSRLYGQKKIAVSKEIKTKEASDKAIQVKLSANLFCILVIFP